MHNCTHALSVDDICILSNTMRPQAHNQPCARRLKKLSLTSYSVAFRSRVLRVPSKEKDALC